jgi:predicted phage terminase large subunit-like protein
MRQGLSFDLNFKNKEEQAKGSYVVGQHWATNGREFYLRSQVRGKWGFQRTLAEFTKLYSRAPCSEIFIEDKANGPAVIDTFRGVIPGIIPVEPKGDKFGRFAAVSPLFHQGRVYVPDPSCVEKDEDGSNWVDTFIEELVGFPNAENDDQVDACSQYLSEVWDPTQEGTFVPYAPSAPSKWSLGGLGVVRPRIN